MQEEPLFFAQTKEDGCIVSGFGWCYSDYAEELGQEKQDIYLYTKHGVIVCIADSVIQFD